MAQAQPQRGLDEQSTDPFRVIPEEIEGQWRIPPGEETHQHDDEVHGHGKKSMLNKMKDKAKTLRTKVKKSITSSHGETQEENHVESQEESLEATSEEEEEDVEEQHQTEDKPDDAAKTLAGLDSFGTRRVLADDNKSSVQHMSAEKDPHISSYSEEIPTEETTKPKTGEVTAEATKSSLGLGEAQQIQDQGVEEKPKSTKFGESTTAVGVDDIGRRENKSTEDNFQTTSENTVPSKEWNQGSSGGGDRGMENVEEFGVHNGTNSTENPGEEQSQSPGEKIENTEPSKEWNQRSSGGGDRGMENVEEFGIHNGTNSAENPGEEQSQRPGEKVDNNVEETNEKADPGKSWSERASVGLGFAKEKLQGYGVYEGVKSAEKPEEESQSSVGNAQDKVSEIGEGKEMDCDEKSPNNTEEVKTGPSETGPGYVREASVLAEKLKNVLSFDQNSSNNKAKDTVIEGEHKENKDEGTQAQQSEGEGKVGQGYASKIFSAKDAISSKLGYGGQTNKEPNVIGEPKPADQIQGTATESTEGAKESKETFKRTIVSKLSPGEDDKALSEVITEAVSNRAKSLKDSLGGLYGGNGKVSTTDTNIDASGTNNQSTPNNPSGGKSIVDRVSGVVGSLLGRKQGDNSEQHSPSEKSESKSQVQVEEQTPEIPKF